MGILKRIVNSLYSGIMSTVVLTLGTIMAVALYSFVAQEDVSVFGLASISYISSKSETAMQFDFGRSFLIATVAVMAGLTIGSYLIKSLKAKRCD